MTWKLDCGSFALFVIEDGYYFRDPKTYHAEASEHDWRFYPRNDQGQVRLNFGCYLITNGEHTIMIDAGMGKARTSGPPGMVTGLMPDAVDELGIDRDSVETVIYTHMHYDHIGGSRDPSGTPVFANARHVFHEKEWAFWSTEDTDSARAAQGIVRPFIDADRVDLIDSDAEILPGVTAVESFGHTPGHLTISIISDGTRTLVGGDVSNHPFQVEHPHWSLPVDNDPVAAGRTRDRVFESIRDTGTVFVAGHYPMPGIGQVVTDDGVRVYRPMAAKSAR
ncbi:MAG: MBL fold metallo-hydrolase [Actinobacteria bacterium]|nr:MAG: MBL fold metallo-hydrolase [Actinomycetota bacterium]